MIENNKKRMSFLDIARGIAIILMVCGHCETSGGGVIEKFVNLFSMSVFIFISGYLFKDKKFNNIRELFKYIVHKAKKLYLFYLKYELLFLALTNIFFKIGFYSSEISYSGKFIYPINSLKIVLQKIIEIVLGMGREPFCGAFWFIISLIFIIFGYSIIQYISYKQNILNKKLCEKIAVIICFIIGCLMQATINIPRVAPAFTLMLVYDLGNEAYINREKIKFNNYILMIICFILLLILNNFGKISMNSNEFTNPLYFIICSLAGIYFVIAISNFILEKTNKIAKVLEYIGRITLEIMAWHFIGFKIAMLIQLIFKHVAFPDLAYLKGYNNSNLWYFVYIMCGIGLPVMISSIKKKLASKTC